MLKNLPPCKYRTGKILGQGTYGTVKEVFEIETGKRYAAKVLNKKLLKGREHLIKNEIVILSKISNGHKNIITLIDYFETTNNLMNLATGGELFDRIWEKGVFYETEAVFVIRTVMDAVLYLHEQGIVHRDLKPENLLYESEEKDSRLLIADFGLARVIEPDQFYMLVTTCGTPGYMAPEIYLKTGYGKPVDLWSIGVITYFLLSGEPPFNHQDPILRAQSIVEVSYTFKSGVWDRVTSSAKDFISKLLVKDPTLRMTASEALDHPWLKPPSSSIGAAQKLSDWPLHFDFKQTSPGNELICSHDLHRSLRTAYNVISAVNCLKRIENFPVDEEVGHA